MKNIGEKDRKELELKMAAAFQENIDQLPTELRKILLDDMVTAFQNRLNVLNSINKKPRCKPKTMDSNID